MKFRIRSLRGKCLNLKPETKEHKVSLVVKNGKGAGRDIEISSLVGCLRSIFDYADKKFLFEDRKSGKKIPCNINEANTWKKMLDFGLVNHQYWEGQRLMSRDYLFVELIQSSSDVPAEVLDFVIKDGKDRVGGKIYSDIGKYLALCRNVSALRYFLGNGYVFKNEKGYGASTMEHIFWIPRLDEDRLPAIANMRTVMLYPGAEDKEYIKTHPLEMAECYAYYSTQADCEDICMYLRNLLFEAGKSLRG